MNSKMLLLFVGLLVTAIGFSCKSNLKDDGQISTEVVNNPNTASGKSNKEKLPKFEFVEDEHDFGEIIQGTQVTFTFRFKNAGGSDLVISGSKAACGCTNLEYPKNPIRPGKQGTVKVTFNSNGRKGFQNKTITLVANTQPNTKVLKIKAMVVVLED